MTTDIAPDTPAQTPRWSGAPEGRDLAGRFGRGNRIASGNPNTRRMHELRRGILEAATPEDAAAVMATLLGLAKGGDVTAAQVWLNFAVGKPVQAIELSGQDGEPARVDLAAIVGVINTALGDGPDAIEKRVAIVAGLKALRGQEGEQGDA